MFGPVKGEQEDEEDEEASLLWLDTPWIEDNDDGSWWSTAKRDVIVVPNNFISVSLDFDILIFQLNN